MVLLLVLCSEVCYEPKGNISHIQGHEFTRGTGGITAHADVRQNSLIFQVKLYAHNSPITKIAQPI